MGLVDDFIARYRRELDFYDQAARLVTQQLQQQTRVSGIRAMVTSRAKNPERLREKVKQRAIKRQYATVDDIYVDIVDLAGARVSLYFPGQRQEIDRIMHSQFVLLDTPKEFPQSSDPPSYEKRFSGYGATHYHVRLSEESLADAEKRYMGARVEVQVASVLMLAWAEVEHDLVYKPTQGELSEDEYAILDELNGLVLAGEVALERLQRASERRTGKPGSQFSNHYDLASFLLETIRPMLRGAASESALGRVDILFELLRRLGLANPDVLTPYLDSLHGDTERRPISEQIIDQVLAADPSRYDTYAEVRAAQGALISRPSRPELDHEDDYARALGHFMTQWIRFERFLEEIARILVPDDVHRPRVPTARWLSRFDVLNRDTLAELDLIRHLRNNLVHGIERPDGAYITEAANGLRNLLEELRHSSNESVRRAMERTQPD